MKLTLDFQKIKTLEYLVGVLLQDRSRKHILMCQLPVYHGINVGMRYLFCNS